MAPHPCLLLLQTALHLAAILEEASAVEKLYAAGSSVLVAERGGHTALHLACRVGAHAEKRKDILCSCPIEPSPSPLQLTPVRHMHIHLLNPVLLPGKSHGWRSLVGCSPWGR